MRRLSAAKFVPNEAPTIVALAPYIGMQLPIGGKATAYICTNYACKLPVTDVARVGTMLEVKR